MLAFLEKLREIPSELDGSRWGRLEEKTLFFAGSGLTAGLSGLGEEVFEGFVFLLLICLRGYVCVCLSIYVFEYECVYV